VRDELAFRGRLEHEGGSAPADVAIDAVEAVLALLGRHREVDHLAGAVASHPGHERVVGVEHGRPGARHGLHDDPLDGGQLAERRDAAEAQVVAGHVRHHRDVVAVVAQALPQDPAARHLEDGGIHLGVLEDHLG
jgi:hypothetical protein